MKIIVFDIGGTSIKYGVLHEENGDLIFIQKGEMQTEAILIKGTGIIQKVKEKIKEIQHIMDIDGVGISTAGMVNADDGSIIYANENIPEYTGMQIKASIENDCKCPCWVENDVNAAALGECYFGRGKNKKDMMMVTIGTGIGSAVIINRNIYHGHSRSAGEIGYMIVNGKQFQNIASTSALVNSVKETLKLEDIDGKMIFERAKHKDVLCMEAIDHLCDNIVQGISSCICLLNPELVILGGGIMMQEEYLQPVIGNYIKKYIQEEMQKNTAIVFAKLGNDAGMMGAYANFMEREQTRFKQ